MQATVIEMLDRTVLERSKPVAFNTDGSALTMISNALNSIEVGSDELKSFKLSMLTAMLPEEPYIPYSETGGDGHEKYAGGAMHNVSVRGGVWPCREGMVPGNVRRNAAEIMRRDVANFESCCTVLTLSQKSSKRYFSLSMR
jgi:hypothetical protein